MPNTATDTLVSTSPEYPGGIVIGQATSSLIAFYGGTPAARRANASQAAVTSLTDGSTGAAAATNGIAALTGTYNSTLLINAIATLADGVNRSIVLANEIRAVLVANGMIKGST